MKINGWYPLLNKIKKTFIPILKKLSQVQFTNLTGMRKKVLSQPSTVRKKLLASFSIILLLLTFLNWMSIKNMDALNSNSKLVKNEWLPSLEYVKEIQYLTEHLIATELNFVISTNTYKRQHKLEMENTLTELDKVFLKYEPLITSEEEKKIYNELRKDWSAFLLIHHKVLESREKNEDIKALEYIRQGTEQFHVMEKSLEKLVKLNHDGVSRVISDGDRLYQGTKQWTIIWMIFSLILCSMVAMILSRQITKPLATIAKNVNQVAEGNLLVGAVDITNKDEIGRLAEDFNHMTKNLRHLIQRVSESTEHVAATSTQLMHSAEQSNHATEKISLVMKEVAAGAKEQVSSLSGTAQAVSDISYGMSHSTLAIQKMADSAMQANQKAFVGKEMAGRTVEHMNMMNAKMDRTGQLVHVLSDKTKEIGKIVTFISQIAIQTNLLALNASIEAARAGQEGRGFAVVAAEVRRLAEQSAESAESIKYLVEDIQKEAYNVVQAMTDGTDSIKEGMILVHQNGEAFNDIALIVEDVSLQSQEVFAIAQEVYASTQSMTDMMNGIAEISLQSQESMQSVAAAVDQQHDSMEQIKDTTAALSRMAIDLQQWIRKFRS